jgi:hypothetical protein
MVAVLSSAALGVLLMMWAPKQAQGEAVLSTLPQRLPMQTVGLVDEASLLIDVLQVCIACSREQASICNTLDAGYHLCCWPVELDHLLQMYVTELKPSCRCSNQHVADMPGDICNTV